MEIRSTRLSRDSLIQAIDVQTASSALTLQTILKGRSIRLKWAKLQKVTHEGGGLDLAYVEMREVSLLGDVTLHGNGRKGPKLRFEDCTLQNIDFRDTRRTDRYSFIQSIHWWMNIP